MYNSTSVGDGEHERTRDFLQRIKPSYSQFIKKNFDNQIVERLDTFGAFAFTSVEREDNKEIPVFFNETKKSREALGSMGVVDLWSQKQRKDLAKRANFAEEKKKIEKFSFYRVKDRKAPASLKPKFKVLHKKNENIYKDILARTKFTEFVEKNKSMELRSPLQRHINLQGKTFYKQKE